MKIAIITDGNNILGMGHVYQSICLAGLLLQRGIPLANIRFLTKSNENVLNLIKESGFLVYHYDDDDLIYNGLSCFNPDRIIFDKLDVSTDLAIKIKKELQVKLVIFTNLTEANNYADITVLARIGSNLKNILTENDKTRINYIGPKYWILRSEFYDFMKKEKPKRERITEIMLMFGGSDPSNLTSSVLNELLNIDLEHNVLIVLGIAFEHNDELNEVLAKKHSKVNVTIARNVKNVAEVMHKSDLLITSPGLTFFEALVVGTPVIVFHQNEQHIDEFGDFIPTMSLTDTNKLSTIIKNKSFIYPNSPLISSLEIGLGKDEIIDEILKPKYI